MDRRGAVGCRFLQKDMYPVWRKKKKNIPLDSWAFAHSYRHAPLVLCLLISCLTTDKALLPTVVPKPQSAGTALGWSASLIVRCLLCKPRGWGDFLGVGDGVKTRVFLCGLGCPGALYVLWLASSFCLLNARIKGICHCIQQWFFLQKKKKCCLFFNMVRLENETQTWFSKPISPVLGGR